MNPIDVTEVAPGDAVVQALNPATTVAELHAVVAAIGYPTGGT